jgi:carbon-monoxide dehydrogenase medium subunit
MPASGPAYCAPRTLDEAVHLLVQHGAAARLMAGGTDLLLKIERGQVRPEVLISLTRIDDLRGVSFDGQSGLSIGATTRLADILEFPAVRQFYPAMAHAISQTATVPIRNMGTIVGNVCNASPCADNVPTLLARGARLEAVGPAGARWIDLDAFFLGPGATSLAGDEIVSRIQVPPPPPRTGFAFFNLSARSRVDMSAVSVAAGVELDGDRCQAARIVLGAVGPVPLRALRAEELLRGQELSPALIREAGAAAASEARPISDVRASADYRRKMVAVLTRRALAQAAERAGAGEGGSRPAPERAR